MTVRSKASEPASSTPQTRHEIGHRDPGCPDTIVGAGVSSQETGATNGPSDDVESVSSDYFLCAGR
jgi:hypothetical protein